MLTILTDILKILPDKLDDLSLWDSLIINRRKPFTYRAFFIFEDGAYKNIRVCLHRFDPCDESDAFFHPHPWPSAMKVLAGSYKMKLGYSQTLTSKPEFMMEEVLAAGSTYSMTEPKCWHSVQPLSDCFSVMINGQPWGEQAYEFAPTTRGKDLNKMSPNDLKSHLDIFKILLK
jgi:hypothetical protein